MTVAPHKVYSRVLERNDLGDAHLHARIDFTGNDCLSYPVLLTSSQGLLYAYFLYHVFDGPSEETMSSDPRAWFFLSPKASSLAFYADCQAVSFYGRPYDAAQAHSLEVAPDDSSLAVVLPERYHEALLGVLDFAFQPKEGWTPEQAVLAADFALAFAALVPVAHRPFYAALAPEFGAWLGLPVS